jgi:hypothetical protein
MADRSRLEKKLRDTLERLGNDGVLDGYYLAGGSALTLHLGHRVSRDLDLFSTSANKDLDATRRAVLTSIPDTRVTAETDVALHLDCAGTPVDFVCYPYAPLYEPIILDGVAVATLPDLGAMKLGAIARRGIRRDFWDVFAICQYGISLQEVADAYKQRYGIAEADLYHVLRALTYFEDANKDDAMPRGMNDALWEEIKAFFIKNAPILVNP